jgi:type II secretory pathway pseudopilin PulG
MIIKFRRLNFLNNKQKGQTLLEAVVTLAVALVIIGSVVTLVNSSNRRSNISRQATQASKLAQQGMEIVRNIRDVNHHDAVQVGESSAGFCTNGTPCRWSELYSATQNTIPAFLAQNVGGDCPAATESWCLISTAEPDLLGIFTRSVEISDEGNSGFGTPICVETTVPPSPDLGVDQVKRITVRVVWDSPTGQSERSVTSCLTDWRQ